MDNNLQLRFELNNLVDGWVDNVIRENGLSYAMMEDALNATLVRIKGNIKPDDQIYKNLMAELEAKHQTKYIKRINLARRKVPLIG